MQKILFAAVLFTLLVPIPSLLYADETPEAKIEKLIEKYGTAPIIGMILRERGAEITVEINGQLRNAQNIYRVKVLKSDSIHIAEISDELRTTQGVPVHDIVTPRSVLFDIEQAGLTVESFAALVQAEEMKAEAERSQRARKVEVVERSAAAIEEEKKRYAAEEERRAAEEKERRQWEQRQAIEEMKAQRQWELQQAIEAIKERRHQEQLKAQKDIRDAILIAPQLAPSPEVDVHIHP